MTDVSISLDDIIAEMDELGRAKFDSALERAKNRKLQERIDELTAQREGDKDAMRGVPTPGPRNNFAGEPEYIGG